MQTNKDVDGNEGNLKGVHDRGGAGTSLYGVKNLGLRSGFKKGLLMEDSQQYTYEGTAERDT